MLSVLDVAAFILREHSSPMTTWKLQKLVYYCQAWSLVWDDARLFHEQIEAWANGPVVRELFEVHRGMYSVTDLPRGNPGKLDETQQETVQAVLNYYGDKSSQWLSDLTHMEDPWKNARTGLSETSRSNRIIPLKDMEEYYSSLPPEE